jgi:NADPH2:quinone reductase
MWRFEKRKEEQMRYIEVTKFGGPEVLKVLEAPTPKVMDDSILIEVKASGVNYADVTARQGFYPMIPSAPFRPGFEVVGVVVATGSKVSGFSNGDLVGAILLEGGGYATHALIPAASAIKFPQNFDPAVAAGLLVQGLTAYLVLDEAGLKAGETVLIAGVSGGVGSLASQIAKLKGARVIGLASESKHKFARERGADAVFDYGKTGWGKAVLEATGGQGADIFLDPQAELSGDAVTALAQKARWFIYGARADNGASKASEIIWPMIGKNISIRGYSVESSFHNVPRALGDLFKWVAEGSLKIDITTFPLTDVVNAHEQFSTRKTTGKIVLKP